MINFVRLMTLLDKINKIARLLTTDIKLNLIYYLTHSHPGFPKVC